MRLWRLVDAGRGSRLSQIPRDCCLWSCALLPGRKSAVEVQNQTAVAQLQGCMGASFASLADHTAAFHAESAQRTSASLQQLHAFLESQNEEYTKLFGCVDDLSGVCTTFVSQHGSALDDSREQATQQWAAASEAVRVCGCVRV